MLSDCIMSREQFNEYVDTYYQELTQSAHVLAKKKMFLFDSLAEDPDHAATILLHEAYINACSTLQSFDPVYGPFPCWFVGIMCHVLLRKQRCSEHRFRQRMIPDIGPPVQEQPPEDDPLDLLVSLVDNDPQDRYIVLEELDELLSSLNARDRTLVTLRFFYGIPGAE